MLANRLTSNLDKNEESGFTLVELLVVILIIGILAAIAIPAFLNQRQRANDSAVESDVRNVATAIESVLISSPNATSITAGTAAAPETDDVSVTVQGATDTADATLSDGVSIVVSGDNNEYVIHGWHENGAEYTGSTSTLVYNSADGGLLDATGTLTGGGGGG